VLRRGLTQCGLGHIPVVSFNLVDLESQPGFPITNTMLSRGAAAFLYGDLLSRLILRTRPYEARPGDAQKVAAHWGQVIRETFARDNDAVFRQNITGMLHDFAAVPVAGGERPKVGIVGEMLVKYHPYVNNDLVRVIEAEGGEVVPSDFTSFVLFCMYWDYALAKRLGVSFSRFVRGNIAVGWVEKRKKIIREELRRYPRFAPMHAIRDLARRCDGLISLEHQSGEGWLLPAEMADLLESGVSRIVCVQPFACLPNHLTGKGMIRELTKRHPEANITAIDFDPGASAVNQQNRIRLMMARDRT